MQCGGGGGPFRAILCRTRVTRDFAQESLTFEEERDGGGGRIVSDPQACSG